MEGPGPTLWAGKPGCEDRGSLGRTLNCRGASEGQGDCEQTTVWKDRDRNEPQDLTKNKEQ